MASTLEQLVVKLDADVGNFTSKMADASSDFRDRANDISSSANSIAQQLSSMKDSFGTLADGIQYIVTPFKLVGGALAALGLDKIADQIKSTVEQVANLNNQADRLEITTKNLQELQYAFSKLGQISGADVNTQSLALVQKANTELINGEGELTKLVQANNLSIADRAGKLKDVNGLWSVAATLIENAKSEADKVDIARILGVSKDLIPVLEQGPEEINKTASAASAAGQVMNKEMIDKAEEFNTRWNHGVASWTQYFKEEIILVGSELDKLIDRSQGLFALIGGIKSAIAQAGANADTKMVSAGAEMKILAGKLSGGRIGGPDSLTLEEAKSLRDEKLFGAPAYPQGLPTGVNERIRTLTKDQDLDPRAGKPAPPLPELVIHPDPDKPTVIPPSKKGAGGAGSANEFEREEKSLNKSIVQIEGESAALEANNGKSAAYNDAHAKLEAAAKQAGLSVEAEAGTIDKLAQAYADAKDHLEQLKILQQGTKDTDKLVQDAAALSTNAFQAAKNEETVKLLNEAKEKGIPISDAFRQRIDAETTAYANAKVQLDQAKEVQQGIIDSWNDVRNTGANALSTLVSGFRNGETAAQAFRDVLGKITNDLFDIAEKDIIKTLLGGSGTTGQGLIGSLIGGLTGIGGVTASKLHGGGIVGFGGTNISVPASVFAGAQRFHGGLAPDEFPAILQRGEAVLTAAQQRARAAGGGNNVTIGGSVINMQGGQDVEATTRQLHQVLDQRDAVLLKKVQRSLPAMQNRQQMLGSA